MTKPPQNKLYAKSRAWRWQSPWHGSSFRKQRWSRPVLLDLEATEAVRCGRESLICGCVALDFSEVQVEWLATKCVAVMPPE